MDLCVVMDVTEMHARKGHMREAHMKVVLLREVRVPPGQVQED